MSEDRRLANFVTADDPAHPAGVPMLTMGQWVTATIGDRQYLAMAARQTFRVMKSSYLESDEQSLYVVVVYLDPNVTARYVRGESYVSFEQALDAAASLMQDEAPWQVGDGSGG